MEIPRNSPTTKWRGRKVRLTLPKKEVKNLVIALMLVCSLAIAQPAWANKPPVTSNPDYIVVTENDCEY